MRPPLRIAVLECDKPPDEANERHGGYGGLFGELIRAGADALGQPDVLSSTKGLEITKWDVLREERYPELDDIDAILLTGSKQNAFDNAPWIHKLVAYVQRVLAQSRVRIIGICFGHQIVGRAMGVKVDRSTQGWEISVCPMQLSPRGKQLFQKEHINLFQMHRDIVYEYPPGVEPLGYSPKCAVHGMYAPGRLITVQGHPEFTAEIMREMLVKRHAAGVFDDEMYNDAMARVDNAHDGVGVAASFLRFLLED
ncbi:class I glutamine amidotransferase-like protein [Xylona heveae TC161]|uniref:Class I glutamine amidotransferase-like protein n=1 Tax=Xylona heveae (strain CBS 132557 / TC161) TaxID=1328760 RepID=A0A165G1J2_XYLHT|nr:class I glutamine amidotransferase-like protein [Xylona heveae TC161]KZF21633.1 class I glutamine amidotransferase-like protein [Xylona heveae TC161]